MSISFIYLYRVTKLFLYCLKVSWVCLMKKKDWRGNKYKVEGVRWNYHISNMYYLPKSFTIVKYFKEAHKAHIVWRENHMTLRKTYNKIKNLWKAKIFSLMPKKWSRIISIQTYQSESGSLNQKLLCWNIKQQRSYLPEMSTL